MATILSRRAIALVLLASCLLLVGSASATVVNVDIDYVSGGNFTGMGAAPDAGTFWNSALSGVPTLPMKASNGAANTSVTFALSGAVVTQYIAPTVAPNLFIDYATTTATVPNSATFTIGGLINSHSYDLYLYSMNGAANNGDITTFTIGGVNKTATNGNSVGNPNLSAFVQNGNYVKYSGLVTSTGAITGTFFEGVGSSTSASFNGFQLVEVVPEPSSIVLSGLGLAGLVAVARQRRRKSAGSAVPRAKS